jgi:probable addiction module antidote protein
MERFDDYLGTLLKNEAEAKSYIDAALEQFFIDHNKELFLVALKQVIDAHGGITKVAKQTNINRQHLYRMLSSRGNPSFDNISLLLRAIGLRLKVENSKAA